MAEIYAPERGVGMGGVSKRDERHTPARQGNKAAVITTVIAVAAILVLLAVLIF